MKFCVISFCIELKAKHNNFAHAFIKILKSHIQLKRMLLHFVLLHSELNFMQNVIINAKYNS